MALNNGLRTASKLVASSSESFLSKSVSRGFHSTRVNKMAYDESYIHSKHMYNLDKMKNRTLKMSLAVFSAFSIGVIVPLIAVRFQQKKAKSG